MLEGEQRDLGAWSAGLSVLVITHRGTESAIPVAKSVAMQAEADGLDVEFVIVGNGCSADVSVLPESPRVRYVPVELESNVGIGAGRAAAADQASGELLVVLDDHVTIGDGTLMSLVNAFTENPQLGGAAFRVLDPVSHQPSLWFYPQTPSAVWTLREFEVGNVVGCGCAFRKQAYKEAGGFWDRMVLCMDEIELTWRVIDRGWQVVHLPGAIVFHHDRTADEYKRLARWNVACVIAAVWRNMPARLAIPQTLIKSAAFIVRGIQWGALRQVLLGMRDLIGDRKAIGGDRSPLRTDTIRFLRSVEAPLGLTRAVQWLRPLPLGCPPDFGGQPVSSRPSARA